MLTGLVMARWFLKDPRWVLYTDMTAPLVPSQRHTCTHTHTCTFPWFAASVRTFRTQPDVFSEGIFSRKTYKGNYTKESKYLVSELRNSKTLFRGELETENFPLKMLGVVDRLGEVENG